jgi:hypothetical protein
MGGRTIPAGEHHSRGLSVKQLRVKGAAAGDITVTGIEAGDPLLWVLGICKYSGTTFINTVTDFTSEFTPGAAKINNTGGTATTNWLLLVGWCDTNG